MDNDDLGVQQREWRLERAAFVVIGALLVAALLGLFGTGPRAWATVANEAGTLSVEYERFARRGGTSALTVEVSETSQCDGQFPGPVRQHLSSVAFHVTPQTLWGVPASGSWIGRHKTLTGEELGSDRLDHAYAVTVHRMQGATVDPPMSSPTAAAESSAT